MENNTDIVELEEIAAKTKYPIGDGDHGFIKPSMYKDSGIPYIRVADIDWHGNINFEKLVYISEDTHNANQKSFLYPGDIIIAKTGATIGKVAIIPDSIKTANTTSSVGKITVDLKKASNKYVLRYFQSKTFKEQMWRVSVKSAQPGFNIINLKKFKIPLPDLKTQQKIASVLEQADAARQKRKQANQLTEQFLQSAFLEMFGDPVRNEKGWGKKQLGESLKIKHGFAFKSEFFTSQGEYVLLTPGNFFEEGGYRDRGEKQKYYSGIFPLEYLLAKDDLLVAMTEQAPGLLGSPILIPESNTFLHNQRLGLVQFDDKIFTTRYLFYLFNATSIRTIIHEKATGTKVLHTSPTKIQDIVCTVPPLLLQQKFASIVEQVEQLRVKQRESEKELENLFQSLMQRYFG